MRLLAAAAGAPKRPCGNRATTRTQCLRVCWAGQHAGAHAGFGLASTIEWPGATALGTDRNHCSQVVSPNRPPGASRPALSFWNVTRAAPCRFRPQVLSVTDTRNSGHVEVVYTVLGDGPPRVTVTARGSTGAYCNKLFFPKDAAVWLWLPSASPWPSRLAGLASGEAGWSRFRCNSSRAMCSTSSTRVPA